MTPVPGVPVVLHAFNINDPAYQHAIKKQLRYQRIAISACRLLRDVAKHEAETAAKIEHIWQYAVISAVAYSNTMV